MCTITYSNLSHLKLKDAAAASRPRDYVNLNINYGSKKSNRLNVESQRFRENPWNNPRWSEVPELPDNTDDGTSRQASVHLFVPTPEVRVYFVPWRGGNRVRIQDILGWEDPPCSWSKCWKMTWRLVWTTHVTRDVRSSSSSSDWLYPPRASIVVSHPSVPSSSILPELSRGSLPFISPDSLVLEGFLVFSSAESAAHQG